MRSVLDLFHTSIQRIRDFGTLYNAINSLLTTRLDLSDILRAQLVFIVSAFDHFIHEVVRIGLFEIYIGSRSQSRNYNSYITALSPSPPPYFSPQDGIYFESLVRSRNEWYSFQKSNKITLAISYFSNVDIWQEISTNLGIPNANDLTTRVDLYVDRRNKIAHESDLTPFIPRRKWPITPTDIENALQLYQDIAPVFIDILE